MFLHVPTVHTASLCRRLWARTRAVKINILWAHWKSEHKGLTWRFGELWGSCWFILSINTNLMWKMKTSRSATFTAIQNFNVETCWNVCMIEKEVVPFLRFWCGNCTFSWKDKKSEKSETLQNFYSSIITYVKRIFNIWLWFPISLTQASLKEALEWLNASYDNYDKAKRNNEIQL